MAGSLRKRMDLSTLLHSLEQKRRRWRRNPEALLSTIQDVSPEAKLTATQANVAKELLSLKARLDVTIAKRPETQLNRRVATAQRRKLLDLTGSSHQVVFNRLKERLFKENPDVRRSKEGAGSTFGRQSPSGEWMRHSLASTQSSRLRESLRHEDALKATL